MLVRVGMGIAFREVPADIHRRWVSLAWAVTVAWWWWLILVPIAWTAVAIGLGPLVGVWIRRKGGDDDAA